MIGRSGHRAPARPRRWAGRTLRGRLVFGLVAVLLLAGVITSVATALFLRGFLVNRLDAQLAAAGGRYSASLEHPGAGPAAAGSDGDADNAVPGQSVGTLGVRLQGGRVTNAAVVGQDGRNRRVTISTRDAAALLRVGSDGRPHTIELKAVGDYRVQSVAGRDGDVQITGLSLHEVDETVGRLGLIELVLFATVTALAAVLGATVVRRTLRPLRRVAETALHVSDLPLTDAATPLPATIAPAHPTTEADQVSVAFDRMLDHLRTALAARDLTEARLRRFVADASHELRTPLSTIRAYSEYATRAADSLPEPAHQAFSRIDAAAIRMATLVDDLLLLARLDAGRPLARDTVDLTQVVVEALDNVRATAATHQWRLDLPDEPVVVTGDDHRLHQLVLNLLANAGAHTPASTTVTATLVDLGSHVRIEICDDGPGIPAEQQEAIFDRFSRADESRGDGHGSSGLGLAIARGIAHAHGGTLAVQSRPGRTAFLVELPCDKPDVTLDSL